MIPIPFDAGSIDATLTLDRDPFQRSLRDARQEARDFARETFQATLSADASRFTAALGAARREGQAFAGTRYMATVGANTDNAALARFRAELGILARERVSVPVGVSQDRTALANFRTQLAALGRESVTVPVNADTTPARTAIAALTALRPTVTVDLDGQAGVLAGLAAITAAANAVGALRPTVRVDVDRDAEMRLGGIAARVRDVGTSASSSAGPTSGFGANLGMVAAVAAIVAPAVGLVSAAIAALPAVAALGGAALGSIALGMDGIKAAATTLTPAVDRMKAAVSTAFAQGLQPAMASIAAIMPVVQTGMVGTANALSTIATRVGAVLSSAQGMQALSATFGAINAFLVSIAPAIADFTQNFLTLSSYAGAFLVPLATGLNAAADGFQRVLGQAQQTGVLTGALSGLAQVINSVLIVFNQLFEAGLTSMAQMAGPMSQTISAFGNLFVALMPILTAFSNLVFTVLTPVMNALAPVLAALAPPFAQLASMIGTLLAGAINAIAPLLASLAQTLGVVLTQALSAIQPIIPAIVTGFSMLASALLPLIPVLGQIASTIISALAPIFPVLAQAILQVVNAVVPLIPPMVQLVASIIPPLAALLPPLVSIIIAVAQGFAQIVVALLPLIPPLIQIVQALLPPLLAILPPIANVIAGAVVPAIGIFVTVLTSIINTLVAVVAGVANFVTTISTSFTTVQNVVFTAWNAVQTVIMTGLVIVQTAWTTAWNAISTFFTTTWTVLQSTVTTIWAAIQTFLTTALTALQVFWTTIWTAISTVFSTIWTTIQTTATTVWTAITTFLNAGLTAFQAFFTTIWNAISAFFTAIWTAIQVTATTVWNAISAFLNAGLSAFQAFFTTIWNAISAFFTGIWATLSATATTAWNGIVTFFNGALASFSNFFRTTWEGIVATFDRVWSTITGIAERVWASVRGAFVSGINAVIDVINRFAGAINTVAGAVGIQLNLNVARLSGGGQVSVNPNTGGYSSGMPGGVGSGLASRARHEGGPITHKQVIRRAQGGGVDISGGGLLPGYTPGRDIFPALAGGRNHYALGGGEYVVKTLATSAIGPQGMAAINNADRFPVDIVPRRHGGALTPLADGGVAGMLTGRSTGAEGARRQQLMRSGVLLDDVPGFAYGGVMPHVARAGDAVVAALGPMPGGIGGVGARANASDHPKGLALDFMTLGNSGLGDRVAGFLGNQWGPLAVKYLIWKQRIANSPGAWSGMEDRGSITANHFDHVHASFTGDGRPGGGSAPLISLEGMARRALDPIKALIRAAGKPFGFPGNFGAEGLVKILDGIIAKAATVFTGGGGGGGTPVPAGPIADVVRRTAAQFGWGEGAQWDALTWIIGKESGWNPNAQNPTSTAYGLFQFLNGTWAETGIAKTGDPSLQALAGMRYIQRRYQDPLGARRFWEANGHYDQGGGLPPGFTMAYNGLGRTETITPLPPDLMGNLLRVGADRVDGLRPLSVAQQDAIDRARTDRAENAATVAALGEVKAELAATRRLLELNGAGATITYQRVDDPAEAAQRTMLLLRTS